MMIPTVDIAARVYNHKWKIDPIVRSLIDTDFYKLLMCQSVFRNRPDTQVAFSLINRSTRIRLAVGQADTGEGPHWRAGGLLIQYIAGDDARGSTEEAWTRTQALFETTGEDELIDPTISVETLLFRLFHEDGVRVFEDRPLRAFCRCSQDRIESVLASFGEAERAEMVEADGKIRVTCEYCSTVYEFAGPDAAG